MGFFDTSEITPSKKKIPSEKEVDRHTINEEQLKKILRKKKKVLLVEPKFQRKFVPLGLAKISTFIKQHGGETYYARSHIKDKGFDCICVGTLFTYDSGITTQLIKDILRYYKNVDVLIGGVYATLMPGHLLSQIGKKPNVKIFTGVSEFLDETPYDQSIDWKIPKPWNEASFVFTTRGCPNNCAYCCVNKLEPELKEVPNWKDNVNLDKRGIVVSDNNCSAFSHEHIKDICDFTIKHNKQIMFNSGFDCKYIDDDLAKMLSKVKLFGNGVRMAFDRIEEDGIYQKAAKTLVKHGVDKYKITSYVLFNFNDTPKEAEYRANEVRRVLYRPYPQRFIPLNAVSRKPKFVGKYWTDRLARAFSMFWLIPGLFQGMDFGDWIKKTNRIRLVEEDIAKYEDS